MKEGKVINDETINTDSSTINNDNFDNYTKFALRAFIKDQDRTIEDKCDEIIDLKTKINKIWSILMLDDHDQWNWFENNTKEWLSIRDWFDEEGKIK